MSNQMQEGLEVLEVLAAFDPTSFHLVAESTTNLTLVPATGRDPLNRESLEEDVAAISGAMENFTQYTHYERELKDIAEQYGILVV